MTRMAQERDSILRLRAKVDSHDEYEESLIDTAPAALTDPSDNRIVLCAPQRPFRLRQVSLGRLAQDFEFENFGSSLAKFFRLWRPRCYSATAGKLWCKYTARKHFSPY